jgi:flagellar motor switch protein FliM
METTFYIILNIITPNGLQSYARFYIGNDRNMAYQLFSQLKGSADINEKNILYLELMETVENLPVNIRMISCSLNELADNCRMITKEIFTWANF